MLALIVATPMTGCSIGAEDSPRTWSDWDRFKEPPESSTTGVERIFLLSDRFDGESEAALTTVMRDLQEGVNAYRGILDVLFRGPTSDEFQQGLGSSIPAGIRVLDPQPRIEQDAVVVNLSEDLTTALGDNLIDALAQIVWTICERPEVRQVRILIEGEAVSLPRSDGTLVDRPLTPFDYPGYVTSSRPDFPGIVPHSSTG